MSKATPVAARQVMSDPVLFLAFGFGSGLAPKAPGTAGTVVALPLVIAATYLGQIGFVVITLFICGLGIWLCDEAARRLKAHDHPGIVWDEFAGLFITFLWFPPGAVELLLGFVLFRLFDIWKPWPIRQMDHSIPGGLGIMLDDVIAGVFAALTLAVARATIL